MRSRPARHPAYARADVRATSSVLRRRPGLRVSATTRAVGCAVAVGLAAAPLAGPAAAGAGAPTGLVGTGLVGTGLVGTGAWPLASHRVVATFDPPEDPYGSGHRGVDLAGRVGEPVLAALAGRVAFAGSIAGVPVVVVSHGPTRTTYQPVVGAVPVGSTVGRGQAVGLLGAAGSHCAPQACLHWGWLRGETYLDPLLLVGAGPVRLLPWDAAPLASTATVPGRSPLASVPAAPGWAAGAGARAGAGAQARGWAWR